MIQNRIAPCFARLRAERRAGLITYVMAGDPDVATSERVLDALVENGADLIELGFPFTDPMADGPAIQEAGQRALKAGVTLRHTLEIARRFRDRHRDVPLILMGYLNPVLAFGPEAFARTAQESGVDGIILVDLPPEEDEVIRGLLAAQALTLIRFATPTTDHARLPLILEGAQGFIYYVSLMGVTGQKDANAAAIAEHLTQLRAATSLPIAVGFGIKTPEAARDIAQFADAVVVGSAIVNEIAKAGEMQDPAAAPALAGRLVRELAQAIQGATRAGPRQGA